jgi:hypothetical protein
MSAAAITPTDLPTPAAADQPSHTARLLSLVRKLIDYGRSLAASLQQPNPASDLADATRHFGISSIALILSRITRGLLRAAALEAGLERGKACLDIAPRPLAARTPHLPRPAQPAAEPAQSGACPPDAGLALLPTPAQIAAEIRRRPAGAVIADICRDLGIMPSHPLWREISELVVRHGGNLATLYIDITRRAFALFAQRCAEAEPEATRPPGPRTPAPAATGPP